MHALPEQIRAVVYYADFEGRRYSEIAEIMDSSPVRLCRKPSSGTHQILSLVHVGQGHRQRSKLWHESGVIERETAALSGTNRMGSGPRLLSSAFTRCRSAHSPNLHARFARSAIPNDNYLPVAPGISSRSTRIGAALWASKAAS